MRAMNAVDIVRAVPLEELNISDGYAALGEPFVARLEPTPLPEPYLIAFNRDVATLAGIAQDQASRPEFLRLAAGCARFAHVEPYAAVYAGHQFGSFVPQLGDGRAIALGELRTPGLGALEWQVKGAGVTPFSRFGDGRAVLRSTVREYLCSEAMAALDIPTTRALAIAGSDATVYRESPETAAVLTRVAPSHLRFGTFEFFHYRGQFDAVKTLADYAIGRFFAEVAAISDATERYATFLKEIVVRTARLIAKWQAVGFAHGVMNTDNMSILGLTLDYGPFGFLDAYDASFVCNHTDAGGRYAFERQPTVGLWNCQALAAALGSIVSEDDARSALDAYEPVFRTAYLDVLRSKFGLAETRADDAALFVDALHAMQAGAVDYTRFFRSLAGVTGAGDASLWEAIGAPANLAGLRAWAARYRERLTSEGRDIAARRDAMNRVNPKYVLRNYIAQRAIERALEHDYAEIARVAQTLAAPFDEWPDRADDANEPPDWARAISVSCSS